MNEMNDFQHIGKKTPYKVPEGFFENISEQTLTMAKHKEKKRRRKLVLWRTLSVAASLALLFVVGYSILERGYKPTSNLHVQNHPVAAPIIAPINEVVEQADMNELSEKVSEKREDKPLASNHEDEYLGEVLSGLSNEDLMLLAMMFETDHFINETTE